VRKPRKSHVEIRPANEGGKSERPTTFDELLQTVDDLTARAERRASMVGVADFYGMPTRSEPPSRTVSINPLRLSAPPERSSSSIPPASSWRALIGDLDFEDAPTKPGIPDAVLEAYRLIA
jgi:hypothetical protein